MGRPVDPSRAFSPGDVFGRLTVQKQVWVENDYRRYYSCICECGTEKEIPHRSLRTGRTTSCGCLPSRARSKELNMFSEKTLLNDAAAVIQLYNSCKVGAVKRDILFELTSAEFEDVIRKPCRYCGDPHSNQHRHFLCNGPDRIDNKLGYTRTNTGPACRFCNPFKHERTVAEMWAHVGQLVEHCPSKIRLPLNIAQLEKNLTGPQPKRGVLNAIYMDLVRGGKEVSVDLRTFEILIRQPCYYCHAPHSSYGHGFSRNGLDRMNSLLGYILSNIVPCCKHCNYLKSDGTFEEFKARVQRLGQKRLELMAVDPILQPFRLYQANGKMVGAKF